MNKIEFFYPNNITKYINLSEDDTMDWARDYVYNKFDEDVNIHHAEIRLNNEFRRCWP
jgi:hypothetical protein